MSDRANRTRWVQARVDLVFDDVDDQGKIAAAVHAAREAAGLPTYQPRSHEVGEDEDDQREK